MQMAGEGVKNKVGVFKALNMYSTELMHYVWLFPFLFGRGLCIFSMSVDNNRNVVESDGQRLISEN